MKSIFAAAAVLLASTAAYAGDSYTFDVGGHTVHIDAPSNCRSASCVSISVPGVFETKRSKRSRVKDDDEVVKADSPVKPADPQTTVAAPAPAPITAPAAVAAVAPVEQVSAAPVPANAPVQTAAPAPQPVPSSPAPVATTPAPATQNTVVAAAPVNAPVQRQQAPTPANLANSPVGVWLTEEKEGKVRIEQCGTNLCGYSVNAKTDANGDEVLINMKPTSDLKWAGRIFDPNSGSTYDSTIALKNGNTLRVQGCAFGGMFCGGQTWSRVN